MEEENETISCKYVFRGFIEVPQALPTKEIECAEKLWDAR